MTETTQIEAGRELDALVAVEVMGWSMLRVDEQETWWVKGSPDAPTESAYEPPAYSTTGDGMLAVLERMRELGWWLTIHSAPESGSSTVAFTSENVGDATAPTLPHAVCLAALEAVRA